MLTPLQRWCVFGSAIAAAGFIAILIAANLRAVPRVHLAAGALRFESSRAMMYTQTLSMEHPYRVTGTGSSRLAARYIKRQFESLGYRVELQRFALWYYGKRVIGENVVATLAKPADVPYVAVMAHYDSPRTSPYAAEDDASGVGTLLELARALRHRSAHPIYVATDAEEVGMLGARALAGLLSRMQAGGTAISIDYINAGAARGMNITASGQFGGYTPLWLRELGRTAEAEQTSFVQVPYGLGEWIDRAVDRSFQDQGPLLQAGIPAINVGTVPRNRMAAMTRYHTANDAYAGFTAEAFSMTGRSVERMILTLDRFNPAFRADGFLVRPTQYIRLPVLAWIQVLGLLPLLVAMVFACWNAAAHARRAAVTAGRFAVLTLPALAAYFLVAQLAARNIMLQRFELYPPPPKDPLLYHPPVLLVLAMIGVLVSGYALASHFKTPLFRKGTLFAGTIAVAIVAFSIQPYGMWLYLGIFAYAALLFEESPGLTPLVLNLALCAIAAVPLGAVLWFYANEMWLGPYVLWYLVLQAAYGVWRPEIVAAAIAAVLAWMQFLRLAVANARAWNPSILRKHRRAAPT